MASADGNNPCVVPKWPDTHGEGPVGGVSNAQLPTERKMCVCVDEGGVWGCLTCSRVVSSKCKDFAFVAETHRVEITAFRPDDVDVGGAAAHGQDWRPLSAGLAAAQHCLSTAHQSGRERHRNFISGRICCVCISLLLVLSACIRVWRARRTPSAQVAVSSDAYGIDLSPISHPTDGWMS